MLVMNYVNANVYVCVLGVCFTTQVSGPVREEGEIN